MYFCRFLRFCKMQDLIFPWIQAPYSKIDKTLWYTHFPICSPSCSVWGSFWPLVSGRRNTKRPAKTALEPNKVWGRLSTVSPSSRMMGDRIPPARDERAHTPRPTALCKNESHNSHHCKGIIQANYTAVESGESKFTCYSAALDT